MLFALPIARSNLSRQKEQNEYKLRIHFLVSLNRRGARGRYRKIVWLYKVGTPLPGEAGKEILTPFRWPLSPRLNSPKNNDPGILDPVPISGD